MLLLQPLVTKMRASTHVHVSIVPGSHRTQIYRTINLNVSNPSTALLLIYLADLLISVTPWVHLDT